MADWASSRRQIESHGFLYPILSTAMMGAVLLGGNSSATAQAAEAGSTKPANAAPTSAAYDVVSIRPNNQGPGSVRVSTNLNVYAATNVSLIDLLQDAYHLQTNMISGEPKWADSARFDIHAKVLDADVEDLKKLTNEDRQRMLRGLLGDRFRLQAHTEVKMLPVYELVVVGNGAKTGSKLKEIAPEDRNTPYNGVSSGGLSIHNGNLTAHYRSMDNFADSLSFQVHRTVLNKTGLPGYYNFQLSWTRDDAPAAEDAAAPPLFTALEEQLGLRLVSTKGPVETLVVDHAEMPTEN